VTFRLPGGEEPRRDLSFTLLLEGGTEKDRKAYLVSIYPPGGAPKKEEKTSQGTIQPGAGGLPGGTPPR
jgi:hypothetical protein